MPSISLGGRNISPEPAPVDMSHDVYGCWDSYIGMQMVRQSAVAAWERAASLNRNIAKHPDHPNTPIARSRVEKLDKIILEQQLDFLKLESNANGYWKRIPAKVRRKECLDEMFGVEPGVPELPTGLWFVGLGSSPPAPIEFAIMPVVLQFVSPGIARVYTGRYVWEPKQ